MIEFDFGHGEELDLLRDTVRDFATDQIAPRAAAIDENNEFPADLWPELGALGVLGITVEENYGGSELGYFHKEIHTNTEKEGQPRCKLRPSPPASVETINRASSSKFAMASSRSAKPIPPFICTTDDSPNRARRCSTK